MERLSRRDAFKILATAAGGLGTATVLPQVWLKPLVQADTLPAINQISETPTATATATSTPTQTPTPSPTPVPLPIEETFTGSTAPGWTIGGDAVLTSGTVDPSGNGWLRLTSTALQQVGFAFCNFNFSSSAGLQISFDFTAWGGSGADGFSVFLFDGTTSTFSIGVPGGSLGYAQDCGGAGATNGYLGIGFDEFGNFVRAVSCHSGGTGGLVPDSVGLRGSGNGSGSSAGYAYLTHTVLGTGVDISGAITRPDQTGANYRKAIITITPALLVTVQVQVGFGNAATTVISSFNLAAVSGQAPLPATLKIGFAASTGGFTNNHEIRNVNLNVAP